MKLTESAFRRIFDAAWDAKARGSDYGDAVEGLRIGLDIAGAFEPPAGPVARTLMPLDSGTFAESRGTVPVPTTDSTLKFMKDLGLLMNTPGAKLPAIKLIREFTGCGLKEAKEAYEVFLPYGYAILPVQKDPYRPPY